MKALVLKESDYDYEAVVEIILVDDDFNLDAHYKEWSQTTFKPRNWANQYSSGVSRNTGIQTISFGAWLKERFSQTIPFEEIWI